MDAYFEWLRDKRRLEALAASPSGPGSEPDSKDLHSPGHGGPALVPVRANHLGFFALYSPAPGLGFGGGGGLGLSPTTLGHFCCCLSIL